MASGGPTHVATLPTTAAGERVIALDPATVGALRSHLARQAQHRLVIGSRWPRRQTDWQGQHRDDPVFTCTTRRAGTRSR